MKGGYLENHNMRKSEQEYFFSMMETQNYQVYFSKKQEEVCFSGCR